MFERYTETARRAIFFARYAASEFGAECIETEHLLLGVLRADEPFVAGFLSAGDSVEALRQDIAKKTRQGEKRMPISMDLPLSDESKHVLAHAAEESEKLSHREITTLHLILGLFRVGNCLGAVVLVEHGISPSIIKKEFHDDDSVNSVTRKDGFVPDAETARRIAEAVWLPVFGQKVVEKQRPFQVELQYNIWVVKGTPKRKPKSGVMFARISKADGSIIGLGQAQ